MTRIEPVDIECPNCGAPGVYEHYSSANVTLDPTLKDRVMDGSLFVYDCPNCGGAIRVETSCLYHDMRKHLLIQLSPGAEDAENLKDILNMLSDGGVELSFDDVGYEIRLVPELNDLREKILIADDDLDDRLVEILKVYSVIYATSEDDSAEFDDVRYMGIEDGSLAIGLILDGVCKGTAMMPMALYEDLAKRYPFESRTEDDYIIDYEWAYKWLVQGDDDQD